MIPLELHIVSPEDYSNPKDSIFSHFANERKKNYILIYFYNFSPFIQIPECEDDDFHEERQQNRATPSSDGGSSATPSCRHNRCSNENYQDTLTPLHHNGNRNDMTPTTNTEEQSPATSVVSPLSPRQFSVVPLESHNNNNPPFISSPNLIIKSIFQSEKPQTFFCRGLPPPPPPSQTLPEKSSGG
ncbi:unnamed protein product [Brassica rapa subsp. narinosa]